MIDLIDYIGRCSSRESTYRLADFFNRWWDEYAQHPAEYITPEQYKAVNAIRVCRTAALGIDTYVCPDCGEVREISHSCKNRFCPSCGWRDTLKWAARMKEKLLRVPHRHVVMTLPHILLDLVKRNKKEILNILMRTSADTLKDWMMHKFGLKTGVIAVKITAMDGENISFRYRDYKNSPDRRNPVEKELTLHYREFFPRLLQHVPLRYFRIVRYYGFYSNKGNLPEEYFGRDESEIEEAGVQQAESEYENPYFCEHCGRMRVYSHTTVTSGGITYTVVLEHCDIHREKSA